MWHECCSRCDSVTWHNVSFWLKSEKKRDPKEKEKEAEGPHTLITLSRRPKYTNTGADFWTDDVAQKSGKNDQKA